MLSTSIRVSAVSIMVAVTVAGCGSSHKSSSTSATPGKTLTICSDVNTPPAEFFDYVPSGGRNFTGKPVGSDIDTGGEIARRLGTSARFVDTPFDRIIGALVAKKCDAIISFMNDTAARRQQISFVDYLAAGQALLVRKGSAAVSRAAELSGKTVSVERGTTEEAFLSQQSRVLQQAGSKPINVVGFVTNDDAIYAVTKRTVDAFFGDTPLIRDAVSHNHGLAFGGQLVKPVPIGVGLRHGDPRIATVKKAVAGMYADGTMKRILKKWKLSEFAITP